MVFNSGVPIKFWLSLQSFNLKFSGVHAQNVRYDMSQENRDFSCSLKHLYGVDFIQEDFLVARTLPPSAFFVP